MDRNTRVLLGSVAAGVVLTAFSVRYLSAAFLIPTPPSAPAPTIEDATPKLVTTRLPIGNGDTLDQILGRVGIDANTRFEILSAFNDAYDVRKVRAGRDLLMTRFHGTSEIDSLEYAADADHMVVLHREGGASQAEVVEIPGTIAAVPVCATLEDSLFEAIGATGEDPNLALLVADIFAYDIDFHRNPQPGDKFCLLVEKKTYDNGNPPTYKRVLAAEYNNVGTKYDAFRFDAGSSGDYFTSDGRGLRSAFLRSPLPFDARVSSRFSRNRLHPVLHVNRSHLGTDYAAPTGTPVRAVASGRVTTSGYTSGNGNYVAIDHANGYRTMYLHLSKRLVRAGTSVSQGQTIGLVGSTGLASGPHLDLRISKNGSFFDWEKMPAQRTVTLGAKQLEGFKAERDRLKALMDSGWDRPQVADAGGYLDSGI